MNDELMENENMPPARKTNKLRDILVLFLLAMTIAFVVKVFLIEPYLVSGRSMEPNFKKYDYLVIDKLGLRINNIKRGQVIVFQYPIDISDIYIKRVIGLPGETVRISKDTGRVFVTAKGSIKEVELIEPYLNATIGSQIKREELVVLGDDEYYMMGDNRAASNDSRFWGPLNKRFIVGRVALRLWPFNKVGIFPAAFRHEI